MGPGCVKNSDVELARESLSDYLNNKRTDRPVTVERRKEDYTNLRILAPPHVFPRPGSKTGSVGASDERLLYPS